MPDTFFRLHGNVNLPNANVLPIFTVPDNQVWVIRWANVRGLGTTGVYLYINAVSGDTSVRILRINISNTDLVVNENLYAVLKPRDTIEFDMSGGVFPYNLTYHISGDVYRIDELTENVISN